MAATKGPSIREAQRMKTRERLMGAAIAEFKRSGMAAADVGAIVTAAGVAHGTFFFHFPTKEHVLLELESREEERMSKQLGLFLKTEPDLHATLTETVRLVLALERRLGDALFKDFLSVHFTQARPASMGGADHQLIVLLGDRIEAARQRGEVDPEVIPINSAVFFLLSLYALAITTEGAIRRGLIDDLVRRTMRSILVR